MTEYRSAFYPDHVLEAFDVYRAAAATGQFGGYGGRATWRHPNGATARTYCTHLHFTEEPALACIKRWHEVRETGARRADPRAEAQAAKDGAFPLAPRGRIEAEVAADVHWLGLDRNPQMRQRR